MSKTCSAVFLSEPLAGTIVAWVPSNDEPEPPEHWVICDGRVIKDAGPFEGKNSPNLKDKFLIGKEIIIENENVNTISLQEYTGINPQAGEYEMNTYGVVYIMRVH